MITFEELLSRAAEPTLQAMVGRDVVRLLGKLDRSLTQPEQLRKVSAGLRAPVDILMDSKLRPELLLLMPRHEASSLCRRLALPADSDPYRELRDLQIRRGSTRANELLDFFSVAADESAATEAVPTTVHVAPAHALFRHQRLAARDVIEALESEPGRVLLHMPTGSGKTRTAMNVICELLNRSEPSLVVWLAHSEELCEQAVEEFMAAWASLGNREVSVTRWWGSHELSQEASRDGVIVAGLAKAHASAARSMGEVGQIAGRATLVVMDEAHQAIAPSYQLVLDLFTHAGEPAALLGLTATPGRTWNDIGEDERLADFFYRRKVALEVEGYRSPLEYLVEEGYLADTQFVPLYYRSGIKLTRADRREISEALEIPPRVVARLAEDEQRNLLIIHRAESMARRHRRMLIFAATVEHALLLATVLRARGQWAQSITGKTPIDERRRIITQYREPSGESRILVNFGVLTTGFDAPRTSGAVIARPTKSLVLYSQMVGRATRGPRAGGNRDSEVATVVDTALPGFSSLAEAFTNWEDVW